MQALQVKKEKKRRGDLPKATVSVVRRVPVDELGESGRYEVASGKEREGDRERRWSRCPGKKRGKERQLRLYIFISGNTA